MAWSRLVEGVPVCRVELGGDVRVVGVRCTRRVAGDGGVGIGAGQGAIDRVVLGVGLDLWKLVPLEQQLGCGVVIDGNSNPTRLKSPARACVSGSDGGPLRRKVSLVGSARSPRCQSPNGTGSCDSGRRRRRGDLVVVVVVVEVLARQPVARRERCSRSRPGWRRRRSRARACCEKL